MCFEKLQLEDNVRCVQNTVNVCQRQEEQDVNDPQLLDWRRDPEKPVILDLFELVTNVDAVRFLNVGVKELQCS